MVNVSVWAAFATAASGAAIPLTVEWLRGRLASIQSCRCVSGTSAIDLSWYLTCYRDW